MSRYPAKHKTETRKRILAAADHLIKSRGVEGASVDAVMRAAHLTVGGFYAHFASKDELASESILYGLEQSMERLLKALHAIEDDRAWRQALIRRYLRDALSSTLETACPLTVMLPDLARANAEVKRAFGLRTAAFLDRVEGRFPRVGESSPREVATFVFASCAGTVALVRAIAAPRARERLLATTEAMLVRMLDDASAPPA